jgi:hypothetical protein
LQRRKDRIIPPRILSLPMQRRPDYPIRFVK